MMKLRYLQLFTLVTASVWADSHQDLLRLEKQHNDSQEAFAVEANNEIYKPFGGNWDTVPLPEFEGIQLLDSLEDAIVPLNRSVWVNIVKNARLVLDGLYNHLPHKEANHGIDPLQALQKLEAQLLYTDKYQTDFQFHRAMAEIFGDLRDLHTRYIVPSSAEYLLPFTMGYYYEGGARKYAVVNVINGGYKDFQPGSEILAVNLAPIDQVIFQFGKDSFVGNDPAQLAFSVGFFTNRKLHMPLPVEEKMLVTYKTLENEVKNIFVPWGLYNRLFGNETQAIEDDSGKICQSVKKLESWKKRAKLQIEYNNVTTGISAGIIKSDQGDFGYLRLSTFFPDPLRFGYIGDDVLVQQIAQQLTASWMPQGGLVYDIRDNTGGSLLYLTKVLSILTHTTTPLVTTSRASDLSRYMINLYAENRCKLWNVTADSEPCKNSFENKVLQAAVTALQTGEDFTTLQDKWLDPLLDQCSGQLYQGPLVLLVNGRIYSASDITAQLFRDSNAGLILGEDKNIGAGGGNVIGFPRDLELRATNWGQQDLPSDWPFVPLQDEGILDGIQIFRFSQDQVRRAPEGGAILEDIGLQPDEVVERTRADLFCDKESSVLQKAAEMLAPQNSAVLTFAFDIIEPKLRKIQIEVDAKFSGVSSVVVSAVMIQNTPPEDWFSYRAHNFYYYRYSFIPIHTEDMYSSVSGQLKNLHFAIRQKEIPKFIVKQIKTGQNNITNKDLVYFEVTKQTFVGLKLEGYLKGQKVVSSLVYLPAFAELGLCAYSRNSLDGETLPDTSVMYGYGSQGYEIPI